MLCTLASLMQHWNRSCCLILALSYISEETPNSLKLSFMNQKQKHFWYQIFTGTYQDRATCLTYGAWYMILGSHIRRERSQQKYKEQI